jgi:transposase InsO family protein
MLRSFPYQQARYTFSPVIDCFDGMVVTHTLSTSPNAEMANTMLEEAVSTLEPFEKPLIHTDCGCHYRWPG